MSFSFRGIVFLFTFASASIIMIMIGCKNSELEKLKNENAKLKTENAQLRLKTENLRTTVTPSDSQGEVKDKVKTIKATDPRVLPYIGKTTYLWYNSLLPGSMTNISVWSKPGPLGSGSEVIKTLSVSDERIPCVLLAHRALDPTRNYFLVRLQDGTEGWIARPYVFKSETGHEHILPNPTTGEP